MTSKQSGDNRKGKPTQVICNYCFYPAELCSNAVIYGVEHGDNPYIWYCPNCHAAVGTHPGTDKPLGSLASTELRRARRAAHAAFDPLWKEYFHGKKFTRTQAYRWLSEMTGIKKRFCHVGMMNIEQCELVVKVCNEYKTGDTHE